MALPFQGDRYLLSVAGATLTPMSAADADVVGAAMAAMDPWHRLGATPERMRRNLATPAPGAACFALRQAGTLAGAVLVRSAWLAGPYLNILAVLPGHQGKGLGRAVIGWVVEEARAASARNAWLCVSAFNADARRFYVANGFTEVSRLDGLLVDHEDEILMRRRLG